MSGSALNLLDVHGSEWGVFHQIKRVQMLSERVREAAERASDPVSQTAVSEAGRRIDFTDETISLDMERVRVLLLSEC